ncbi:MAG TPA: cytochrome c3 family protein [Syntrophorhabdaceae bacterium]|nr:cytochrome c3 family protein [Syntrophorhabdaceae bacterium]HOL04890.1 cytochrome c3 family protein [Syntrophorhabdaceae bacterium]HON84434.1 cytochrome c3 family protein [Syntrophorhabdaceae bacterium]HOT41173.1 cytochrome c3 family protein [Syntrophorhabdaceae bacterium]HPC65764.1 cytochrome c3 family protein [Syntrophorhabdaceae bacterium]
MKKALFIVLIALVFATISTFSMVSAQKKAPEPMSLKIEGGKLPAVSFSHITHTEKTKIECITCHHKDKDPKNPEPCIQCHLIKEVKDNAPIAKEAYHKNCIDCHKESTAKGKAAPTKCNECHKKQQG